MKTLIYFFSLLLLLTGCAQIPQPVNNVSWFEHQQQLQQLTHWSFSGKLAIITQEERNSLNIHWLQAGDDFHIVLSTFLGGTVLEVQKTDLGTKITDKNGKEYINHDSKLLIKQLSGLTIPIKQLQQWIKGDPADAEYQLNEQNQIVSLLGRDHDKGMWIVNYNAYQTVNKLNLPAKLQLKKENLRLKFAISKWEIAP